MRYTIQTLVLDPNVLRDSILVRMEIVQFEAYLHVNAIMWRQMFRELRALTNDKSMGLNPLELNDLYEELWNVGTLLQGDGWRAILDDAYRPWPRLRQDTPIGCKFYAVHDRHKVPLSPLLVSLHVTQILNNFHTLHYHSPHRWRTCVCSGRTTHARTSLCTRQSWEKSLNSLARVFTNP